MLNAAYLGVIRKISGGAMICTQCGQPFSDPAAAAVRRSLFGLCQSCGGVPRFRPFVNDAGAAAACALLSFEFALLSWLFQGWGFFLIAVASTMAVYVIFLVLVHRGRRTVHRTEAERRRSERWQRIGGSLLGFTIGMAWFLAALSWGHS